jgi:hypothetical protein
MALYAKDNLGLRAQRLKQFCAAVLAKLFKLYLLHRRFSVKAERLMWHIGF